MDRQKLLPSPKIYDPNPLLPSSLSKTLSSSKAPQRLGPLHSLLLVSGLARSPFFAAKLISKYSDLGNSAASLATFLSTPHSNHSVFLWNTLMRACTHTGLFDMALNKYDEMRRMGLSPDAFTFPSVLSACAGTGAIESGRRVHRDVLEFGFGSDLYIANTLISMYSRLGSLADAREVFDGMPLRDVVSWNSLISGYSANGMWEEALEVYSELRMAGVVQIALRWRVFRRLSGVLGLLERGKLCMGL